MAFRGGEEGGFGMVPNRPGSSSAPVRFEDIFIKDTNPKSETTITGTYTNT